MTYQRWTAFTSVLDFDILIPLSIKSSLEKDNHFVGLTHKNHLKYSPQTIKPKKSAEVEVRRG